MKMRSNSRNEPVRLKNIRLGIQELAIGRLALTSQGAFPQEKTTVLIMTCYAVLAWKYCLSIYIQICYGIIYGMGSKSLSEQLLVSEDTAEQLMNDFQSTFTGKVHADQQISSVL